MMHSLAWVFSRSTRPSTQHRLERNPGLQYLSKFTNLYAHYAQAQVDCEWFAENADTEACEDTEYAAHTNLSNSTGVRCARSLYDGCLSFMSVSVAQIGCNL